MKIDYLKILICLAISLATICAYDYIVINPKLKSSQIETVDIELLVSKNEKLVKEGKLSIEAYKKRLGFIEDYVLKHRTVLITQYVKVNDKLYPIAFGGVDITGDIDNQIEAIK